MVGVAPTIQKFINQFKSTTMFYKLKKTLVAAALLPLALGCKREEMTKPPIPNQLGTQQTATNRPPHKVEQWLKTQSAPQPVGGRKAGTALPSLTLQWAGAGFDAATNTHYVPAAITNSTKAGGTAQAYLVATENEQGQVTGGQYIMVLPNAKKMGNEAAKGVNPAALLANEKPKDLPAGQAGFSGAILQYDLKGQLTGSQVYEGGQLQPKATANLAIRDEGEGSPSPNKVQQECGAVLGINPCIDWYWQTYVNGVLAYEDYMFTTCCGGNGGGGGGGGTGTPAITSCERTQAQAEAILGGITLENTNIITMRDGQPYGTNANEPIRKPKQVRWEFLKLRQYLDFYLRYTMVFNGVVFKNNAADPAWKWESLAVGNLERSGTMAPCFDVNLTYNVVDPLISADKRLATSGISYVAVATVPCALRVEVGTYTGNHPYAGFYANSN
jgi:hypothetical protein